MEAKYTPGPWRAEGNIVRSGVMFVSDCDAESETPSRIETCKANARRIVACVNACDGIPTEALECQSKRKISESWVKQRDKLVSACQRAEAFIAGFEDDETQEGIAELLAEIRSAASLKSTA